MGKNARVCDDCYLHATGGEVNTTVGRSRSQTEAVASLPNSDVVSSIVKRATQKFKNETIKVGNDSTLLVPVDHNLLPSSHLVYKTSSGNNVYVRRNSNNNNDDNDDNDNSDISEEYDSDYDAERDDEEDLQNGDYDNEKQNGIRGGGDDGDDIAIPPYLPPPPPSEDNSDSDSEDEDEYDGILPAFPPPLPPVDHTA